MSYAIIGFGKMGHALAKAFARKGIEVSVEPRATRKALHHQKIHYTANAARYPAGNPSHAVR